MKNTTPLLLLVVVVVVVLSDFRDFPSPALAQSCLADHTISAADEVENITIVREAAVILHKYVYVRPGPGFKGVSLVVEAGEGGNLHAAWFPKKDMCFQMDADWWEVIVDARISWIPGGNQDTGHDRLEFRMWTDACLQRCVKKVTHHSLLSIHVIGHGTSAWRLSRPGRQDCTTITVAQDEGVSKEPLPCKVPPTARTSPLGPDTTPGLQLSTIVAAVVPGIGVVVMVAAVVMLVMRRRGEAVTEDVVMRPQNTESPREENATVNSLYESFDRQESVNSLYEPFENVRPTR